MKTSKKLVTSVFTFLAIAIINLMPLANLPAQAASANICSQNVSAEVKAANGCGGSSTTDLQNVIVTIINSVVAVLGLVAVVFIIVGGVNYMTSAGDASKIEKAKKTILYAVIGLVVCALAFAIVNFVVANIIK